MNKSKKRAPAATLAEQLKAAILGRGLAAGEVARMAGVDHRVVGRFLVGERGLTLDTAGKVAAALGLRLR